MNTYVFGYGSLINVESLGRGLQRNVEKADLIPVILKDYARTWSLKEQVLSDSLGREITAVFLNVEPSPGKKLNGVLVQVNEIELGYLKSREKNYDCVDVTSLILTLPHHFFGQDFMALTFVSREDQKVKETDRDLYVMKRYVEKVESACRDLGRAFYQEYLNTTQKVHFELVDGGYSLTDPLQKKYV